MKIMVLSYKGGCGKSTVSMQVAAPYIYKTKKKPVDYFEYDTHNEDAISFSASKIVAINKPCTEKENAEKCVLGFLMKQDAVIDVGGGLDAETVLEILDKSRMIGRVDTVIIPLTDGEVDTLDALKTVNRLIDISEKSGATPKVAFALTKTIVSDPRNQFEKFFGDPDGWIPDEKGSLKHDYDSELREDFDKNYLGYIMLPYMTCIRKSRYWKKTVFELAGEKTLDDDPKMTEDEFLLAYKRNTFFSECQFYKEKYIEAAFKVLDGGSRGK